MTFEQSFVDYYEVLQVDPACDAKMLELAYHHLAKAHHPDRSGGQDSTKFHQVVEAYRALRDPDQRAEYDHLYAQNAGSRIGGIRLGDDAHDAIDGALEDAEAHKTILMLLYDRRRRHTGDAGVVGYYIQQALKCSDEEFEFYQWYLKEKNFIAVTEHGTIAITIQGVDHVISMSRTSKAEKLLLARSIELDS